MSTWTEYGVVLDDWEHIAPAVDRETAYAYDRVPGRLVVARDVKSTALPKSGEALVDYGDWRVVGRPTGKAVA